MQASIKAFASHNWGHNGITHARVVKVCNVLRERGVDVWLDETHMRGNILDAMCHGIDESDVVIVFVTREYIKKVQSGSSTDNVRREFMYASQAAHKMIAVRFDADLGCRWPGPVGMVLGSSLYVDMSKDPISDVAFASLVKLMEPHARPKTAAARVRLRSAGWAAKTTAANVVSRNIKQSGVQFVLQAAPAPTIERDVRSRTYRLANILNFQSTDLHIAQIVSKAAETLGLSLSEELKFHDRLERVEAELGLLQART